MAETPLWQALKAIPKSRLSTDFRHLRDIQGRKLADGDFAQWHQGGRLHVRIVYRYSPVHEIEEDSTFNELPALVQERWSWRESNNGRLARRYEVDFESGRATAEKLQHSSLKRWSSNLQILPGRTFAGFGFTLALIELRERLLRGEKIELKAVGVTPKPRVVSVEISDPGLDQMKMGDRTVRGDRFVIHPELSKLARLFVTVPDTRIWLIKSCAGRIPSMGGAARRAGRAARASRFAAWKPERPR